MEKQDFSCVNIEAGVNYLLSFKEYSKELDENKNIFTLGKEWRSKL